MQRAKCNGAGKVGWGVRVRVRIGVRVRVRVRVKVRVRVSPVAQLPDQLHFAQLHFVRPPFYHLLYTRYRSI